MKFSVDTAVVANIKELNEYGFLDGVTTNPSLIARSGHGFKEVITEIFSFVDGSDQAEVAAMNYGGLIAEVDHLAQITDNFFIELPLTLDDLKASRCFSNKGIKTKVALSFTANQALWAAKAGATYISAFVGRLDDINIDGMELICEIRVI